MYADEEREILRQSIINREHDDPVPACQGPAAWLLQGLMALVLLVSAVSLIGLSTFGVLSHSLVASETPLYISPIVGYNVSTQPITKGTFLYQPCVYPLVSPSNDSLCQIAFSSATRDGAQQEEEEELDSEQSRALRQRRTTDLCCPQGYELSDQAGYCVLANSSVADACDQQTCLTYLQSTAPLAGSNDLILVPAIESPLWLLWLFVGGFVLLTIALMIHYYTMFHFVSVTKLVAKPVTRTERELNLRRTIVCIMAVVLVVFSLVPSAAVSFMTEPDIDDSGTVTAAKCFGTHHTLYFWMATYLGSSFTFAIVLAAATTLNSFILLFLVRPCCGAAAANADSLTA